jgi:site-specific DNA recombinase
MVMLAGRSAACQIALTAPLLALIEEAMAARAAILEAPDRSMRDAAVALGQCRHRLGQLVRLSNLAPTIVKAIADGRHPASLTPRVLLAADLPLAWNDQKALLGFA